jgi:hypothetical protein
MSLTILETIAVELHRRLSLMVGNTDYGTNVSEVIRPTRLDGFTPKDLQIVLTQGSSEEVEDLMCPGNPPAVARRQTFNVRCHVMSDEESAETIDKQLSTFASDVIRCVCTGTTWHTFDGNAIDANWLSREDVAADGGLDGVNLPIAIVYRTDENNPYNLRT